MYRCTNDRLPIHHSTTVPITNIPLSQCTVVPVYQLAMARGTVDQNLDRFLRLLVVTIEAETHVQVVRLCIAHEGNVAVAVSTQATPVCTRGRWLKYTKPGMLVILNPLHRLSWHPRFESVCRCPSGWPGPRVGVLAWHPMHLAVEGSPADGAVGDAGVTVEVACARGRRAYRAGMPTAGAVRQRRGRGRTHRPLPPPRSPARPGQWPGKDEGGGG